MRFIFKNVLKVIDSGAPNGTQVKKNVVSKVRPRPGLVGSEGE
jgi:hypothetical protein